MSEPVIIYTHTDEAPALATASFLPIVEKFTRAGSIAVEARDISLAARILAEFPQNLRTEQQVPNARAELGALATDVLFAGKLRTLIPQTGLQRGHGLPIPLSPVPGLSATRTLPPPPARWVL